MIDCVKGEVAASFDFLASSAFKRAFSSRSSFTKAAYVS